jgi:aryl carrier-like protein
VFPGTPGELWLAGAGVTRGYLGRPALTAERYRPDPFTSDPGGRVYTTGDLVRHLPDGRLSFLGRIDHQVKIRGFRIELGEIEAALLAHPEVAEAVVVARPPRAGGDGGGPVLVAYHAPGTGRESADAAELRELLARTLPGHMLPSRFVALPALPRNPNGKVDRGRLPEPEEVASAGPSGGPPREGVERELAALWSETLGVDPDAIGRDDHFFLLGGHSLVAARLLARLREGRGVELTMAALFRAPTLAGMARTVAGADRRVAGEGVPALPRLVPAADPSPAPLSFAQLRLWLLDRMAPGLPVFNMPEAWDLDGPLDPARLAGALSGVVRRHEAWRTRLVEVGEVGEMGDLAREPRQVVAPPAPVPLPVIDLSALPDGRRSAETERLTAEEGRRPFDLSAGPLVRARLLRLGPGRHRWLLNVHHVVSDAWSQGVAHREIAALYDRGGEELPALVIQYPDYARWQHDWPDGYLEGQLAWWVDHLAGWRPLELPADRPRPARPSYRGSTTHFRLSREIAARVEEEARRRGATEYMVLLAAFQALVARICGQDDFVSGTPVANRGRTGLEPLLGFFVNLLPQISKFDPFKRLFPHGSGRYPELHLINNPQNRQQFPNS